MMHNMDLEQSEIECDELTCEKQNRLGLVTLNAPKQRNAINVAMRQKLIGTYKKWVEDPDVYTILLQSDDAEYFSSGANVKEVSEIAQKSKKESAQLF